MWQQQASSSSSESDWSYPASSSNLNTRLPSRVSVRFFMVRFRFWEKKVCGVNCGVVEWGKDIG